MYKIERRNSGYLLTFGGAISKDDMQKWVNESRAVLAKETASSFGVIIDMRTLAPLPTDAQALMVEGQGLYKTKGMKRSAVVVLNNVTAMQFKRLAQESGIYQWERYIAATTSDWSDIAIAWVRDGVDPDNL